MSDAVPPVHDYSRVDAFTASRRRTAFLHAIWRPLLAGAAGAALVIAAVAVAQPRFSYREIEIPKVTMKDVTVPNIIQRDVTVDHVVTRDVVIPTPVVTPALPSRSPDAAEKKFIDTPEFKTADISGRIARRDGLGFRFDSDEGMWPVHEDGSLDATRRINITGLIVDFGYCNLRPTAVKLYSCFVIHNDVTQPIPSEPTS
jgi:hypothetical protein